MQHHAIFCAAPILIVYGHLSNPVTVWLNRPPRAASDRLDADREFLLAHALRIWRYFLEFGAERHNFLIPDNVDGRGPTRRRAFRLPISACC